MSVERADIAPSLSPHEPGVERCVKSREQNSTLPSWLPRMRNLMMLM
jgi:hypothetical protein